MQSCKEGKRSMVWIVIILNTSICRRYDGLVVVVLSSKCAPNTSFA